MATLAAAITVELQDVELEAPNKPKDSAENTSRQSLGFPIDFEMQPLPMRDMSLGSGSILQLVNNPESRRVSNEGNRDSESRGAISEQVQTIWHPYKNRFRLMAACATSMANGMNDSAPGALIASLERSDGTKECKKLD